MAAAAGSGAAAVAGFGQAPTTAQIAGATAASVLSGLAAWLSRTERHTIKKTGAQFAML